MSNLEKVEGAFRKIAKPPFEFWRVHYPERVISHQPEVTRGPPSSRYGTLEVLISGEGPSAITLRIHASRIAYLRGGNPAKEFYRGTEKIAAYESGLRPLIMSADLDDNETNAVEAFAKEVKLKSRS